MTAACRVVAFMTLAALPVFAMAQKGKAEDKAALQKMYVDFLKDEGYKPEVDSDGDVLFKSEGKSYFINVVEDDPTYFRVVLANIWPIESEEERVQCLVAVDHSNNRSKVTKSYIVKDNIWVGVEVFLAEPEDFKKIFARCMSAVNNGVALFASRMREQQSGN